MNKVKQEGINSGGDTAGRDIKKTINVNLTEKRNKYLCSLMERFKKERDGNIQVNTIIDELTHYKTPIHSERIIGLENKLKKGKREDLLDDALITKEKFTKKLLKYELFESAQEIYAILLAHVYYNFRTHIVPIIKEETYSNSEINKLIDERVIDPLFNELDENVLKIYKDEINGMIYFLTGNCHIRWI